jgi:hypothetical protein
VKSDLDNRDRFENTSRVLPATSRRSGLSASSPSRAFEGARGGNRWSAAEGSGSTSSCVRAGGAAGRGERGAGKAGRVARRARGKGAGQHTNRRGRTGPRSSRTHLEHDHPSEFVVAVLRAHELESGVVLRDPPPRGGGDRCRFASKPVPRLARLHHGESTRFAVVSPPSPAVSDGLLEPHARGLLRGPHQHALHLLAQASAGLARRDRHARPRPEN